ncbi:MAG: penicillin-binding protein 1C [Chthoniobacterales bacterium]
MRTGIAVVGLAGTVWLATPKPPLLDGITFSQCVRDRNGKLLRLTLSADQKFRIRTSLHDISPELIRATLQYEDKHYGQHPGINPLSLVRCAVQFVQSRRIIAGGSTITMQVARLRFHLQTRSLSGKLVQVIRALQLERHYSKDEILEAYLNLAPYGRNIEGAGAAGEMYFGKPAARLTGLEAMALSVIPQSPTRRALSADHGNPSLNKAQENAYRRTDRAIYSSLPATEFSARIETSRDLVAPHFVQQVLESSKTNVILTTLDLSRQLVVEKRIRDYIAVSRSRGIENAAALVVDTRSMDVVVQAGSADFRNITIHGQVDGTRSLRSPGSTLKPFVYALAMEQGLIHPSSILPDAPRSFGQYNPENFDRDFLGPIRASDALARSRNLPAVLLASQLSHPTLYEFLRTAGVSLPRPSGFYGLALPLGGAEVSMQDLVRLYAMLANNGELRPLRRTTSDPLVRHGQRVLSPESSFLTLEMLRNVPRPELNCSDGVTDTPVFWKTGTSHGFRDAWSVAVFDHYVVAVWVGNFDGRGSPAFVGRTAAGPLLFQIIDSLRAMWPEPTQPHLPPPGANLKQIDLCAVSGDLPHTYCPQRIKGWFIPGVSPIRTCDIHREVLVDVATGLRVAVDDGTRQLRRDVYEFWPGELQALFERAGLARRIPPPFVPGTSSDVVGREGRIPEILPPAGGARHEVFLASSATVPLRAKVEADVRAVYWFDGNALIAKAAATEVVSWKCNTGDHEIIALDDHGRSGTSSITIR